MKSEPRPEAESAGSAPRAARPVWLFGLPSLLLLVLVILPLASGSRTLYYRDVLNSHYPLKAAQAQLQQGTLSPPLIDPYRGGGQPLLGNPNAVPFYPTNVFYRLADPLWALNAHFWLHWLLAPLCGYWLGRAWRLDRVGSWACGVAWATGGYVLSLLNLFNLVATATLTPALVAAFVGLRRQPRQRWRVAAAAVLTALVFLGGDPSSAALAYLLAAGAWVLARPAVVAEDMRPGELRAWTAGLSRALAAAGLGGLLAAPVIVELLRILPHSYRGLWRYQPETVLAQSWHPATLMDWWIPGFFGRIDLTYWGLGLFDGNPPLFSSLFPGWIVLALAAAAGVSRRRPVLWAWGAVAGGLFLALGGHNPLLAAAGSWSGSALLRYPVKAWLAVAVGLALLAGLGFDRLLRGSRRAAFGITVSLCLVGSAALRLMMSPESALVHRIAAWAPNRLAGPFLDGELERWWATLVVSMLCLALALLILILARRRPRLLALLLVLHTASQLYLLAPLFDTDLFSPYPTPPPALGHLPPGVDVEHGGYDAHFGSADLDPRSLPGPSLIWVTRSGFAELLHAGGVRHGLRYPFTHSPEGLDSFLSVAFAQSLAQLDDVRRLRLLEAGGVDYLLLHRSLEAGAAARTELTAQVPSLGRSLRIYRLSSSAPDVSVVHRARSADSLNAALALLVGADFDPALEVVLPDGSVDEAAWPGGFPDGDLPETTLLLRNDGTEGLTATVDSMAPSVLVTRRAWLPIWRAAVDGQPAEVLVANGYQMAVAVPPGRHEVVLSVDRRPTDAALAVAGLALLVCFGQMAYPPAQTTSSERGGIER